MFLGRNVCRGNNVFRLPKMFGYPNINLRSATIRHGFVACPWLDVTLGQSGAASDAYAAREPHPATARRAVADGAERVLGSVTESHQRSDTRTRPLFL